MVIAMASLTVALATWTVIQEWSGCANCVTEQPVLAMNGAANTGTVPEA